MATENIHDDDSSGEEEVIRDEPISPPPTEEAKKKTAQDLEIEAAYGEFEKASAEQSENMKGIFAEMDTLMSDYQKMKDMISEIAENDPRLKKYL